MIAQFELHVVLARALRGRNSSGQICTDFAQESCIFSAFHHLGVSLCFAKATLLGLCQIPLCSYFELELGSMSCLFCLKMAVGGEFLVVDPLQKKLSGAEILLI